MNDILRILAYMAPLDAVLLCLFLLVSHRLFPAKGVPADKQQFRLLMCYYGVLLVNWISPLLYIYFPAAYVHEAPAYLMGLMLSPVIFYRFVHRLTGTEATERFSHWHYAAPCALGTLFAAWSLMQPYDVRLALITSRGLPQAGHETFSLLYGQYLNIRGLYTLLYTALCFYRIFRYRKAMKFHSADKKHKQLQRLRQLLFLSAVPALSPLFTLFHSKQEIIGHICISLLAAPLYMTQYALLCYQSLTGNFAPIPLNEPEAAGKKQCGLKKEDFEAYIKKERPYLETKLKITDLVYPLGTNRSYLSAFINKEYGMNFNRYINRLRLEELARLRREPKNGHLTETELIQMAGFGTYNGYKKFLNSELQLAEILR